MRAILADYVARPASAFDFADYGVELDTAEQRRRYVIQSLLQVEGLSLGAYRARFGSEAPSDLPQLGGLAESGLAENGGDRLRLTAAGLERSDVIGPWLYSAAMRARMEGCPLQ